MQNRKKTAADKITDALFEMLKTKKMREIAITELHQAAGVSRVSFYRNFDSVDHVMVEALNNQIKEWAMILSEKQRKPNWPEFQSALLIMQPMLEIIYAADAQYSLYLFLKQFAQTFHFDDEEKIAKDGIRAGLYFGLIDYWVTNGYKDFDHDIKKRYKLL